MRAGRRTATTWIALALAAGCASPPEGEGSPRRAEDDAATQRVGRELDAAAEALGGRGRPPAADGGAHDAAEEPPPAEAGPTEAGVARDAAIDATEDALAGDGRVPGDATAGDGSAPDEGGARTGPDVQSRFLSFRTSPSIGLQWHPLEFEPKAVICFGTPVTTELPERGSAGFVVFSDGRTTAGVADAMTDDDTVSGRAIDVERGIILRPGAAAQAARFDVRMAADGFELQYDVTDGEAYAAGCLALGGADVQARLVTTRSEAGSVRDLPLTPELIFAITPGDGDNQGGSQGDDHPLTSFGVCDARSLSQWWFGMYSDDRADGKRSHVVEGKLVGETMFWNSAVTEVFEGGFDWEAAGGDDTLAFLAVEVAGLPVKVGLLQAESSADGPADQELDELGFTPQAMGFVSAAREVLVGLGESHTSHAAQALGMVDARLHQATLSRFTELGADNSHQRWGEGSVLGIPDVNPAHAALGEVIDMSDSTPTLRWSKGDGRRYRIGYFALGSP